MKVILTGGGTGGHIYPTLALAEILQEVVQDKENIDFLYVGTRGKLEEDIVPKHGYKIVFVKSKGFPGFKKPVELIHFLLILMIGVIQATKILIRFKPDLIIATGGYVSAPILIASILLKRLKIFKIKTFVHEQNVVPGKMNRFVGRFADLIGVTFKETRTYFPSGKTIQVGYPVRKSIGRYPREEARSELGLSKEQKLLLIFGGSSGAKTINEAMVEILPELVKRKDLFIVFATGKYKSKSYRAYDDTINALKNKGLDFANTPNLIIKNYIYDMDKYLAAADLVICRAGAGTIYEILSIGLPAIFIPKALLPGEHQVLNARIIEIQEAGRVIYERVTKNRIYVPIEELKNAIYELLEDQQLREKIVENTKKILNFDTRNRLIKTFSAFLDNDINQLKNIDDNTLYDWRKFDPFADPNPFRLLKKLEIMFESSEVTSLEENQLNFLHYRTDVLLSRDDWELRNVGIKLIGLTRYYDKISDFPVYINDRIGFIRRNLFKTIERLRVYNQIIKDVLVKGLCDNYYEVRSWALSALLSLSDLIKDFSPFKPHIIKALKDRNFEVRMQAIKVLAVLPIEKTEILKYLRKNYYHPNTRVREAVVWTLRKLFERNVLSKEEIEKEINELLITSNDFLPHFELKEQLYLLQKLIREKQKDIKELKMKGAK